MLPAGYTAHEGGACPVEPDAFVDLIVRTGEGLGHSGVCRARLFTWEWDELPDAMGAVLGYRRADVGETVDIRSRWPE